MRGPGAYDASSDWRYQPRFHVLGFPSAAFALSDAQLSNVQDKMAQMSAVWQSSGTAVRLGWDVRKPDSALLSLRLALYSISAYGSHSNVRVVLEESSKQMV